MSTQDSIVARDRVLQLLSYDANTGVFRWRQNRTPQALAGSAAGSTDDRGAIKICLDRRMYKAHRLAWLVVHGEWPTNHIDHINGNPSDNRAANLRDVPRRINNQNYRRARVTNVSGLLGVTQRSNGTWFARVRVDGKTTHLGTFSSPEDAHSAYVQAKRQVHEGCTI